MAEYAYEGLKDSVKPVKFKGEAKDKLRSFVQREYHKAEGDRSGMLRDCKALALQAASRRKRKDARPRDSNIDMPLTRKRMMQNGARLKNPILQQETLFVTPPRSGIHEDMARELEAAVDYMSDQIDYNGLLDDWIEQFQIFPCGVVKTPFITKKEKIVRWEELDLDAYNETILDEGSEKNVVRRKLDDGNVKYYKEINETIIKKRGAFPEVVPFEDFIVPSNTADIETADWVIHRVWLTKYDLEARIREGIYDKRDGDNIIIDSLGDPEATRDKLIEPNLGDEKKVAEPAKQYEILEMYLCFDVDGDDEPEEIILTWEAKSGIFLRAVHNFYHIYRRPFVTYEYKKIIGSIFGTSLAYMLEPLHVANSASFNQRLDMASLANEKIVIVPPQSDLEPLLNRDEFRGGLYQGNVTRDEVIEFTLSQPFNQLPELEENLNKAADEVSSLSPYSFGQEQIQRPTATGQVQIIEESKQPQYDMLERFRKKLALVGLHVLARYKQFFPEGLQYYIQQETPEGQQLLQQVFQWPDVTIENAVFFETKVSSASMSKMLRKQELTSWVDKMPQLYETMMGMAQSALDPMNPAAMVAGKMLIGFQQAVDTMMTEFDLGKKEVLNPDLVTEVQIAQQIQAKMQELTQQVQQLGTQLQSVQAENAQLKAFMGQGPGVPGPPQPQPGVQGSMQMGAGPQGPPVG